jgi:hypothetical protein
MIGLVENDASHEGAFERRAGVDKHPVSTAIFFLICP